MKGNKKIWIASGVVVTLGLFALAFALRGQKEAAVTSNPIYPTVQTTVAAKGDVSQVIKTNGTVDSGLKKTFFSPVNATVKDVNYQVGDVVSLGQELITFDLKDLEEQNTKANLNVQANQYGYQDTINKSNEAINEKNQAAAEANSLQAQVNEWQAYVDSLEVAILQANLDAKAAAESEAKAAAKAAKKAEKEMKTLLKKENEKVIGAQNDRDEKQTAYDMAFAMWETAQTDATKTQDDIEILESAVSDARAALTQAEADLKTITDSRDKLQSQYDSLGSANSGTAMSSTMGTTPETADTSDLQQELESASQTLAELKSEQASAEAQAEAPSTALSGNAKAQLEVNNNLTELEAKSVEELIEEGKKGIKAEFNGVVSESTALAGSPVAQGTQLLTLQSLDDVNVSISVSKNDYTSLKEGQKAKVIMGNFNYEGTVSKISKIARTNEQGVALIDAIVHIDNPDNNIFLGVEAKVEIYAAEAKDVIVIPVELINSDNEGDFCYVLEDNVITRRPIEKGISSDTSTEIVSGLSESDIVISDIGSLSEGDNASAGEEDAVLETETE